jgi:hypothetical protein
METREHGGHRASGNQFVAMAGVQDQPFRKLVVARVEGAYPCNTDENINTLYLYVVFLQLASSGRLQRTEHRS